MEWGLTHSKPCNFSETTYPQDGVDKSPCFPKNHLTHHNGGFSLQKEDFHSSTMHTNPCVTNSTSFLGHFSQTRLHDHHLFHAPKVPLFSGSRSQQSMEPRRTSTLLGSVESIAQITWDLETRESILNLSPHLSVSGSWSCPLRD